MNFYLFGFGVLQIHCISFWFWSDIIVLKGKALLSFYWVIFFWVNPTQVAILSHILGNQTDKKLGIMFIKKVSRTRVSVDTAGGKRGGGEESDKTD